MNSSLVNFNESDVLQFDSYYLTFTKFTIRGINGDRVEAEQLVFDTDKGKYLLAGSELLLPDDSELLEYCDVKFSYDIGQDKKLYITHLLCDVLVDVADISDLDGLDNTHITAYRHRTIKNNIFNKSFFLNRFYLKDGRYYNCKDIVDNVTDKQKYFKTYYAYATSLLFSFLNKYEDYERTGYFTAVRKFVKSVFDVTLELSMKEMSDIFPVQHRDDKLVFEKEPTEPKKLRQPTQTSKTAEQSQICKKLDELAKGVEKVGTSLDTLLANDRHIHIKADDITLSNEGFKLTNESLKIDDVKIANESFKLDDVKIANDIKLATDTSTVLRQTYSLENVADTSMLSIGDYTDKLSKDFLNETATSLHETRNFLLNYRLFGNAVSHSNIVAVKGSTGSGKTTLVKAWALGYNAIERHTSAIRHAKYYNEINIDTCVGDEDIFVAKQITNLSTVSCDTSVLGIMRALEADYVKCKAEGREFKDRAVIVISDARCVDFDRVFSKIKGLACYEGSDFIVNKEVFHIMGNITWVIIYNDKGKGSMELSLPMARRAMFVNIDMIEVSYDDVKNSFTDDAIDLFDIDKYSLESFVEALNNINAKIRDNEYSTVGYIPYNMLLYPKEKYGTAIDVYNLLVYYKNLYSIVLSESGGTIKDDFLSCLFDDVMRSVIDEF